MESATWVLAFATVALMLATVGLLVSTLLYAIAARKLVKTERLGIISAVHRRIIDEKKTGFEHTLFTLAKLGAVDDEMKQLVREGYLVRLKTAYEVLMNDMVNDILGDTQEEEEDDHASPHHSAYE